MHLHWLRSDGYFLESLLCLFGQGTLLWTICTGHSVYAHPSATSLVPPPSILSLISFELWDKLINFKIYLTVDHSKTVTGGAFFNLHVFVEIICNGQRLSCTIEAICKTFHEAHRKELICCCTLLCFFCIHRNSLQSSKHYVVTQAKKLTKTLKSFSIHLWRGLVYHRSWCFQIIH